MSILRSFVTAIILLLALAVPASAGAGAWDILPAVGLQEEQAGAILLDVRTMGEFYEGHALVAHLVPWVFEDGHSNSRFLEKVERITPSDRPVVVICRTGHRSAQAAARLRAAGYTEVYNVLGGSIAWHQAALPWQDPVR